MRCQIKTSKGFYDKYSINVLHIILGGGGETPGNFPLILITNMTFTLSDASHE